MSASTTFVVTLRTHGERAHRRLAQALKFAGRQLGLRCVDVREILSPDDLAKAPAPRQGVNKGE
jgi:hypothetical protein